MIRGRKGAEERVSARSVEMSLRSRARDGNSAIKSMIRTCAQSGPVELAPP